MTYTSLTDEALLEARRQCRIHGLAPVSRSDYAHIWALAAMSAREDVCAEEGHRPREITEFQQPEKHYVCSRCGHTWQEERQP